MNVPRVPELDDELVVRHRRAHLELREAHDAAGPEVRRLFLLLQRRLLIESLAYVQPVTASPTEQQLFPPPRAFLTRTQELRMFGADAVYRHLDSRIAMRDMGAVERVLDRSTPVVFHALLEGLTPSGRETNPGMLRATPTAWKPEANSYMHPPATMCSDLVDEALDVASGSSVPSCVRGAWLTFTMLSIHPFVDGNGRTSRALYLAVVADDVPLGLDFGVLEQWSITRSAYVAALQQGQRVERYDGERMDARPFVEYATITSTVGAELCAARIARLGQEHASRCASGSSPAQSLVLGAASVERVLVPDQLAALGGSEVVDAADDLLTSNTLRWVERPPSRRTTEHPERWGLALAQG